MERRSEIRANCSNCKYVIYYHIDPVRFERCSVFRMKEKFNALPTNPLAMESVLNGSQELCEKYQPSELLRKNGINVFYHEP
ncbi:MAG: hypothetical protein QXI33_00825 [Candidatus Pacearchaeota archaeon]